MILRALGLTALAVVCLAQTTNGLIHGRLVDAATGRPLAGARVEYSASGTGSTGTSYSNSDGYFFLPLISPGLYRLRVTSPQYQPREAQELELAVAGQIEIGFRLRPLSDVWEGGQYRRVLLPGSRMVVTFYGPDVDTSRSISVDSQTGRTGTLEATVSQVLDPAEVRTLPLAGRDLYSALVTQPGVTADLGTSRGLGLSVSGQRPTSANFLLDGVEFNHPLLTGPLAPVAPEAVQEYRVSTSNYSAQYGKTAGFVANAVTRGGGNTWHAVAYTYLRNEALNANDFQRNRQGMARTPAKELQPGFQAGGPLRHDRWFSSTSLEWLRGRSRLDESLFTLPTRGFFDGLAAGTVARTLLDDHPPAQWAAPDTAGALFGQVRLSPPASVDRYLVLQRFDSVSTDGRRRWMGRLALSRFNRPDFFWSPYPDFTASLEQNASSVMLSGQQTLHAGLLNEVRAAGNIDRVVWDRPHPEVPILRTTGNVLLPGGSEFHPYRNEGRSIEVLDNVVWVTGRHILTAGASVLHRGVDGAFARWRDGEYSYDGRDASDSLRRFASGSPDTLLVSVERPRPALVLDTAMRSVPPSGRHYAQWQSALFAQETWKATPRLTVNYGLRWERFGPPRSTGGASDLLLRLGSGGDFVSRLKSAAWGLSDGALFSVSPGDWAGRFGFSRDLTGRGRLVLRGAYGVFYDHPYENLWQTIRNNRGLERRITLTPGVDILRPPADVLAAYPGARGLRFVPEATAFEDPLRSGYVHHFFLGTQKMVGDDGLTVEVNGLGALGRRLISTDRVNRTRITSLVQDLFYRGTEGASNYYAGSAAVGIRRPWVQARLAYTWSHAIDNQSEPLVFDPGDFGLAAATRPGQDLRTLRPGFSREFDSRGDRGSSDFDQRHNLVLYSLWTLPSSGRLRHWLDHWSLAQMAAFRTGFPFSVWLYPDRAPLLDPAAARLDRPDPASGGVRLLNASAFSSLPAAAPLAGRNTFSGPGLYNLDLSVSRSFLLKSLGETTSVGIRADFFNVLNHANLDVPNSFLGDASFGIALFGRRGRRSGFPAANPLEEAARQIQLSVRFEF